MPQTAIAQTGVDGDGPQQENASPISLGAVSEKNPVGGEPSACVVEEEIPVQRAIVNRDGVVGQRHAVRIKWKGANPPPSRVAASVL